MEHVTAFEKYLVSISTGGIVFVFLFTKSIFEMTNVIITPLLGLIVAPVEFGIAVLFVLLSVHLSQQRLLATGMKMDKFVSKAEKRIGICNVISLVMFVSAFITSIFHVSINVSGLVFPNLKNIFQHGSPWIGLIASFIVVVVSLSLVRFAEPRLE